MPESLRAKDRWTVLGAALAMRLAYVALAGRGPLYDVLVIDSAYYHERGAALARGEGAEPVYFMAPLYQYLLGGLYALVGPHPLAAALVQAVLGAAAALLAAQLATRLLGDRRTGLATGIAVALYPTQVFLDGSLLTAGVIQLLNLGALCLIFGPGRPWHGVAAGALLGLSALARANVLLFVALLLPAMVAGRPRGRPAGAALRAWGAVALGTAAAILPATLRNAVVGGELVVTSANAGMNFYTGNRAGARGVYVPAEFLTSSEPLHERDDFRAEAARRLVREVSAGEASRFWMGQGLARVAAEPAAALALVGRKLFVWLNRVEAPTNLGFYFAREHVPLLWLPLHFGILAPLGLVGLALSRGRRLAPVYAYLLAYLATCLVFFVSAEYRAPVVPVLAAFAVHAVRRLAGSLRRRTERSLLPAWAGLLALAVLCNVDVALTRGLRSTRLDYLNFATVYTRRGQLGDAEQMLGRCLEIDPGFLPARQKLAAIYRETGRASQAAELGAGIALDEILIRARTALDAGELGTAEALYEQALALDPPDPARIWVRLGTCAELAGEPATAAERYRRALEERPGHPRARLGLARALLALGDRDGARAQVEAVLEQDPQHAEARALLGEIGD